ncbi:MAG: J domain-containing protein [Cyanobacteria bacterium]|nr:J domain-containing protein [Cyanobacteriota bacterium]
MQTHSQTTTQQSPWEEIPFLSSRSQQALDAVLATSKNPGYRYQKLADYFKTILWLNAEPDEFLQGESPLNKLSPELRRWIQHDLSRYFEAQAETKAEMAEKRKAYQSKVFAYFRETVSRGDKALLEALRDYELDKTGYDRNWRHYFGFKSIKRIDAFCSADRVTRSRWIEAFKEDIATYERNIAKHTEPCHHSARDDFDLWCEFYADSAINTKSTQSNEATTRSEEFYQACRIMGLKNTPSLSWDDVKKQFRLLTLQHHPDRPGGDTQQMQVILDAFAVLKPYFAI